MNVRKFVSLAALVLLALGLMIAPVAAQDVPTLTVGFAQEPDSMNGFYSSMAFAQWANDLVQSSLWDISDTLEAVPVLVTEVPSVENGGISEDYMTYTIHLKEGLMWSDGTPLTSDDLVFTYQMLEDPANNMLQGASIAEAVESVEAIDATTFTLTFNSPKPFPEDIAGSPGLSTILPAHIFRPVYEAEGSIEFAEENQDPTVFSGAYTLTEWRRGEQMTFEVNPNYALGAPSIGRIVLRFFPDTETQYAALQAGQLDFVPNISEGDKPRVSEFEGVEMVTVFGGYIESLWLNLRTEEHPRAGHPALQDVNVRQAIRFALDRQAISDALLAGTVSPTDSIYAGSPFEDPNLGVTPHDIAQANALLDAAGWVDSNNDGTRDKDGVELVLRYSTTTAGWRNNIQAVVQQQLAEVGVGTILEAYPASEFFGAWANSGINAVGEYDIAQFANNTALTNPANVTVYESLNCAQIPSEANPGGQNFTGFCSEEMDAAAQVTLSSLDEQERLDAAYTIQTIMRDNAPLINLFPRGDNYAFIGSRFAETPRIGSGVGNTWFDIVNWQLAS
ncbi:MAG: peptide ABC transporter substrate-binding protein [Chloroflexi bacterium]|uniref:peptide ABC transporter substrate-binding protein n=1 Tax=Candidatus Flexifilum breve TaxID=3140694 RepID=UPI003134A719|nr:peptide ABC transporter substrate-binding protein [Chloroflexota bacterium]